MGLRSAWDGNLCEAGPVKNNERFGARKILYWNSWVLLTSSIWSFAQPDTIFSLLASHGIAQ